MTHSVDDSYSSSPWTPAEAVTPCIRFICSILLCIKASGFYLPLVNIFFFFFYFYTFPCLYYLNSYSDLQKFMNLFGWCHTHIVPVLLGGVNGIARTDSFRRSQDFPEKWDIDSCTMTISITYARKIRAVVEQQLKKIVKKSEQQQTTEGFNDK